MPNDSLKDSSGTIKLDIGCGLNKKDGYIGIDKSPDVGADFLVDIECEPLPFSDSSVDEIYCAHLVEHIHNLIPFMNECYRVLKPGGRMEILAPYYTAIQATQDPTHVRFISENSFNYFTDEYLQKKRTFNYGINCLFKIVSIDYTHINVWSKSWVPHQIRHWARRHLFNVAVDITTVLAAVKPMIEK